MTYGRALPPGGHLDFDGALVSHKAELVRGDFIST